MRKLYSFLLAFVLVVPAALAQGNYIEYSIPGEIDITESYPGIFQVNEGPEEGYWVAGIQSGSGATIWGDSVAVCNGFTAPMIYVEDLGPEQTPGGEGCTEHLPILNDLTGKIALVRRGVCEFGNKALNAEQAGAVGVVVYNDERVAPPDDTTLINMGGGVDGPNVTIPGLFIGFRLGQALAEQIQSSGEISVSLHARSAYDVDTDGNGEPDAITSTFDVPGCGISPEIVAAEPAPGTVVANRVAAYPNPTSGAASVALAVDRAQHVDVAVYDMLGREVAHVYSGTMAGGVQQLFDVRTSDFPAGLYFVRATGESFTSTQQLTVVR